MKAIGISLILLGLVWASIAFNADTSVETGGNTIGQREFQIDVPKQRVNNLGLMEERRNHLMFAGLTILVGVILVGFGSVTGKRSAETTGSRACPFCAELVKIEAKVCRYCQRDLPEMAAPVEEARVQQTAQVQEGQRGDPWPIVAAVVTLGACALAFFLAR